MKDVLYYLLQIIKYASYNVISYNNLILFLKYFTNTPYNSLFSMKNICFLLRVVSNIIFAVLYVIL